MEKPGILRLACDGLTNSDLLKQRKMRLLVIELSYSAGTLSVMRQVMPRLSEICEEVYYCGHNADIWRGFREIKPISFGELTRRYHNWVDGIRKRLGGSRVNDRLFWSYIERLIETHKITHVFMPWIVGQRIPKLSRPTGGIVMDLLWRHFPGEIEDAGSMDSILMANINNLNVAFPVSTSTAEELKSTLGISDGRVFAIPHGTTLRKETVISECGLGNHTKRFFLYPAQTTENKNHLCLFEAVRLLADKGEDIRVVLTSRSISRIRDGDARSEYEMLLKKWLSDHPHLLNSHISLVGEVEWNELDALYGSCHAVVLPSLYEGFGLPLVEAFERNVPVICSKIAPFEEQISRYRMEDRVLIVDPMTPHELSLTMRKVLAAPRIEPLPRAELITRLSEWSWDDAALAYRNQLLQA
jgi:glycosyltransferase involved in cell wall biosynthesis